MPLITKVENIVSQRAHVRVFLVNFNGAAYCMCSLCSQSNVFLIQMLLWDCPPPHVNTCAKTREIQKAGKVVVTNEEVVTVPIWVWILFIHPKVSQDLEICRLTLWSHWWDFPDILLCIWWNVFITELKRLATPGWSSDAAWKAACAVTNWMWQQWSSQYPDESVLKILMYLPCCGHTGSIYFTIFNMSLKSTASFHNWYEKNWNY